VDARVVVLETDRALDAPRGWKTSGVHRYGGTLVTMLIPKRDGAART